MARDGQTMARAIGFQQLPRVVGLGHVRGTLSPSCNTDDAIAGKISLTPDIATVERPVTRAPKIDTFIPLKLDLDSLSQRCTIERQRELGLEQPLVKRFVGSCEFISLGCFCAVARSLQSLGLKKYTYPFDWTRTPLTGVVQCLNTQFQDFFSFEKVSLCGQLKVFESTVWGGSFWHHNPEEASIQIDFARRIHRLFGLGEVAAQTARAYVRAANSSKEVEKVLLLWDALKQATPNAKVYLLVIVDMQAQAGLTRLIDRAFDGLLFCCVHECLYTDLIANDPNMDGMVKLQLCSDWYGEAIAVAVRFWAGDAAIVPNVRVLDGITDLCRVLQEWDGCDAAYSLFSPHRVADFVTPRDIMPCQEMTIHAFGRDLKFTLPSECIPGQSCRVRLIQDVPVVTFRPS